METVTLRDVKMECDAGDVGGIGGGTRLEDMPLRALMDDVLTNKDPDYVDTLVQKLEQEGISESKSLLMVTKEVLQNKLAQSPNFSIGALCDVLALRGALEGPDEPEDGRKSRGDRRHGHHGHHGHHGDRRAQRGSRDFGSREHSGRDNRRGDRSRSPGGRAGRNGRGAGVVVRGGRGDSGIRIEVLGNNHRGGGYRGRDRRDDRRERRPHKDPPPLWDKVSQGDINETKKLLDEGADVDERHEGWTPLMKAAEEGHCEIASMLLDKGADIEASNRKGRSVLSFAAAPSMKRPFHPAMVRLLAEKGANLSKRDENGLTAKGRAETEKREDSVSLLQELEERNRPNGM